MEYLVVRRTPFKDKVFRFFIIDDFIKVIGYSQFSKSSSRSHSIPVERIHLILNWDFEIIAGTEKFIEYAKTKRSYKGVI